MKQFSRLQYEQIKSTQDWIDVLNDDQYNYNQINQSISTYVPGNKSFWKVAEIRGDWIFDKHRLGEAKVSATDFYSYGTFKSERADIKRTKFQFGYNRHALDPVSEKIVESLNLANITADVNLQPPGGVKCSHYDTLCSLYADKDVDYSAVDFDINLRIPKGLPPMHRLLVALSDWEPGWMFQIGVEQWVNWKKGDVIALDWRNAAHSTANASMIDRPLLKITASADNNWIDECIHNNTVRSIHL